MTFAQGKRAAGAAGISAFALLAASGSAFAQTTPPAADTANSDEPMIVVTGSRIARPEYSQPNPIVTSTAAVIEQSGNTNLTDFLAESPALLGSQTNIFAAGSNLTSAQAVGVNNLNLRNLGTSRTLVLLNGRRHIAGTPGTAAVDVNTIPTDLVERVDVLTGGVSAIYGADGVSGVVNFILRRDFDGLRVRGQAGISQRGDAGQRFGAATLGKNFADGRGNITLAYEFSETDRFRQTSRLDYGMVGPSFRFVRNPADFPDNPTIPDRVPLTGLRWADSSPGGAVDLDLDGVPDFTGEGAPYNPGTYVRGSAFTIGGDSTPQDSYFGDYVPYLRRHNVNALARFEISPALKFYAEGKYVSSAGDTFAQPTYDFLTYLFPDNAYLSQRYGAANAANGAFVTRDNFDFGIRQYELDRELWRAVVGAEGELSQHLRYDLSYVYGEVTQSGTNYNDRIADRYYAALDAVVGNNGQITCRINLPGETEIQAFSYNGIVYGGTSGGFGSAPPTTFQKGQCVPLNVLGAGSPSQAALDFFTVDHTSVARISHHVVSGSIAGDTGGFFELPGGPVAFAVGAEYRKESSLYTPSSFSQAAVLMDDAPARIDRGSFDVKEVFGEINLPLLKDVPLAYGLSIGGAVRYSDYSTVGGTTTWKVDGSYAPVRDVTFRATYSQAVRAPNITELFAGGSGSYEFIVDPCGIDRVAEGTATRAANCNAALTALGINPATFDPANDFTSPQNSSLLGFQGGNSTLEAETAKTWTAGVVLRPRFVPGLVLSADWYDIRLKQAIQYAAAQDLVDLCYDQPTLVNQYCDLISRGGNQGFINNFSIIPQNVAAFRTAGLDVALDYRINLSPSAGAVAIKLVGNYLDKLSFVPSVGAPVDDELYDASYPAPRYSANFDLTWTRGPLTLNYGINWFSKTRRVSPEQQAANPDYTAPEYIWFKDKWEHQIYADWNVDDRFDFYMGVNNLFDTKPDVGAVAYPIDATGRFFFFGVKAKLF